jgi:hypothetical protein
LALPSLTGGGRSVGIVRSRTEAMEFIPFLKENQGDFCSFYTDVTQITEV